MPKGEARLVAIAALVVIAGVIVLIYLSDHSFEHVTKIVEVGLLTIGLFSLLHISRQSEISAKQAEISADQSKLTATLSQGLVDQATESSKWRKRLSYHDYFSNLVPTPLLLKHMKAVTECGITEKMEGIKELDKHQVDAIFANEAFKSTFARYLDCYEGFCAAVHAGVVDKDYAYTLEATKVIRAWTVFKPFVRRLRSSNEYSRCYLELERLGAAWKQQRDQEIEESNRQQGVRAAV